VTPVVRSGPTNVDAPSLNQSTEVINNNNTTNTNHDCSLQTTPYKLLLILAGILL